MKNIQIVEKADGSIEPEESFTVRRHRGETFQFLAPAGTKGLTITFVAGSPFRDADGKERRQVGYGEDLTIAGEARTYGFTCEVMKNGVTLRSKTKTGGEIEVPPLP
ncbi:MAG: hypothetical protein JNK87_26235 [Bryobacterales bacterium]|nr:hypothetical protein [Bryobacterales bacterium]